MPRSRLAGLALLVMTVAACSTSNGGPEVAQPATSAAGAVGELEQWFDGAQGQRRLLLIMSPT